MPVLLFKGAALAYSIYPEPWLRPREDTDLLVDGGDASRAGELLGSRGYQAALMQSGELVTNQRLHVRSDASGLRHDCDLHWKIANPVSFAELLTSAEADAVVPIPPGSATSRLAVLDARMPSSWPAGIAPRITTTSPNLLWLYDLHLLAKG